MNLIKENIEKNRKVYKLDDRYRKVWQCKPNYSPDKDSLEEHLDILDELMPGYVIDYGLAPESLYIDYKIIPGVPANTFPHTKEFIDKIYNFCVDNINKTSPYAHRDWVLSNILIDGDNMHIVDWDNVGVYEPKEIIDKLHSDLKSAFGENFDPPSI